MTKRMNDEELSEAHTGRRFRADQKAWDRLGRMLDDREEAARQVGQLCREGQIIFYTFIGGKYRESSDPLKLV